MTFYSVFSKISHNNNFDQTSLIAFSIILTDFVNINQTEKQFQFFCHLLEEKTDTAAVVFVKCNIIVST